MQGILVFKKQEVVSIWHSRLDLMMMTTQQYVYALYQLIIAYLFVLKWKLLSVSNFIRSVKRKCGFNRASCIYIQLFYGEGTGCWGRKGKWYVNLFNDKPSHFSKHVRHVPVFTNWAWGKWSQLHVAQLLSCLHIQHFPLCHFSDHNPSSPFSHFCFCVTVPETQKDEHLEGGSSHRINTGYNIIWCVLVKYVPVYHLDSQR